MERPLRILRETEERLEDEARKDQILGPPELIWFVVGLVLLAGIATLVLIFFASEHLRRLA